METPLQNINDFSEKCLITLHKDGRLRLWDLLDGKCFLVSSLNRSGLTDINIIRMEPLFDSKKRFVVLLSREGQIYLCDIWTLNILRVVEKVDFNNIRDFTVKNGVLYIIDNGINFAMADFSDLNDVKLFTYDHYVFDESLKAKIKAIKKINITYMKTPIVNSEFSYEDYKAMVAGVTVEKRWFKQIITSEWVFHMTWDRIVVYKKTDLLHNTYILDENNVKNVNSFHIVPKGTKHLKDFNIVMRNQKQRNINCILFQTVDLQMFAINFNDVRLLWSYFNVKEEVNSNQTYYNFLKRDNYAIYKTTPIHINLMSIIGKITPEPQLENKEPKQFKLNLEVASQDKFEMKSHNLFAPSTKKDPSHTENEFQNNLGNTHEHNNVINYQDSLKESLIEPY